MRIALVVVAAALLSACGLLVDPGEQGLSIVLPGVPPSWSALPDLAFEVEWLGAGGGPCRARAAPGSRLLVDLPRGLPQAIRARAISGGRSLAPAGALYPFDLDGPMTGPPSMDSFRDGPEELDLDWPGGYVAETAARLEAAGLEPFRFDLARLEGEVRRRVVDPWASLPPAEAARRLAAGSFRADALREKSRFALSLPGPGPWAPESPLAAAPVEPGSGAEGWLAELSEGEHRFLGPAGELRVAVEAAGGAVAVRIPGGSPGAGRD